jgi:hypothetical protein
LFESSTLLSCFSINCRNSRFVIVFQNEERLWNLTKFLQSPVQRVLLGIGVQALEELRGCRDLQSDGRDKAQRLIALILNEVFADIALSLNRPSATIS